MIADRTETGITPQDLRRRDRPAPGVRLVNEAAHILEEGIACKASDIDIVYIFGYGFPSTAVAHDVYADTVGLFNVVQTIGTAFAVARWTTPFWQPAPLLARLAAEARPSTEPPPPTRIKGIDMTSASLFHRPPAGQSWKGAFNMTHGATLGRCTPWDPRAVERAGIAPAPRSRTSSWAAPPRRRHRRQHRPPDRAWADACHCDLSGVTINRFCSSACRPFATAPSASSPAKATSMWPAVWRAISCVQRR